MGLSESQKDVLMEQGKIYYDSIPYKDPCKVRAGMALVNLRGRLYGYGNPPSFWEGIKKLIEVIPMFLMLLGLFLFYAILWIVGIGLALGVLGGIIWLIVKLAG